MEIWDFCPAASILQICNIVYQHLKEDLRLLSITTLNPLPLFWELLPCKDKVPMLLYTPFKTCQINSFTCGFWRWKSRFTSFIQQFVFTGWCPAWYQSLPYMGISLRFKVVSETSEDLRSEFHDLFLTWKNNNSSVVFSGQMGRPYVGHMLPVGEPFCQLFGNRIYRTYMSFNKSVVLPCVKHGRESYQFNVWSIQAKNIDKFALATQGVLGLKTGARGQHERAFLFSCTDYKL